MQTSAAIKNEDVPFALSKTEPHLPAFSPTDRAALAVIGGLTLSVRGATFSFAAGTPIPFDVDDAEPGSDHLVIVDESGALIAIPHGHIREAHGARVGGFHYAPGGNASVRGGGDDIPAINPFSCWDLNFRPECDPRGMALVDGKLWVDIYLTVADHLAAGTSRYGMTIADGDDLPAEEGGGTYRRCDHETAVAIAGHHGKRLLSVEEFARAAYGVTERSSASKDPNVTGLDAARTSKFGIMQATGNLWAWCTDGDPDEPRASFAGGSWISGSDAGSRFASVGYNWPVYSDDNLGLRACCDHLTTV